MKPTVRGIPTYLLEKRSKLPPCCESGSRAALQFLRWEKILNVSQTPASSVESWVHLRFFSIAKTEYQPKPHFLATGRFCLASLAMTVLLAYCTSAACERKDVAPGGSQATLVTTTQQQSEPQPVSFYKGWDYLAERLRAKGVAEEDLVTIYRNPQMPYFTFVPFKLKPREPHSIYSGFLTTPHFRLGANFIRQHRLEFDRMEKTLKVPREVVAAILVVESQIGRNTGKEVVLYRLSRVSSVADPMNVRRNFEILRQQDSTVSLPAVEERAHYLETTFLPEIPALIEISKRNKINILRVRGSSAGAFGLPQFLPSAFLRFGFDGNRDGLVSLYNEVDALWSAANYLASYGYREELPLVEQRAILWRYNKSDAYIDTVLAVAGGIDRELD